MQPFLAAFYSLILPIFINMKKIDLLIKKAINETINELNLYHSSYANFNKFNHKKYLSSGAGSQSFGWGTYLTDSYPIAKSYAENFIIFNFNNFVLRAEPQDYVNGTYDEEVLQEALKLYKMHVRFGISMSGGIVKYSRNSFDDIFDIKTQSPSNEYDDLLKKYEQFKQITKACLIAMSTYTEKSDEEIEKNAPNKEIVAMGKEAYINQFNFKNSVSKLVRQIINSIWDDADMYVKKEAYIYEVEIPDDNGCNYIYYESNLNHKTTQLIENGVNRLYNKYGDKLNINRLKIAINECYRDRMNGEMLYKELVSIFNNSQKAASLFLLNCGIDGIKYRAGTIYDLPKDADENSYNYVVFDANKIKIVSKNLFVDNLWN